MKQKFIQIITGQWKTGDSTSFNHTLYGLTDKGEVYRFMVNQGWVKLEKRDPRPSRGINPDFDEDLPF